jgi:hypothetical protein
MQTWFLDRLREEAAMIRAAPLSFSLAVVACLVLSFMLVRWIYKERLTAANDLLNYYKEKTSISRLSPEEITSLKKAWEKSEKKLVFGKTFRNEKVPLDGFSYVECEFTNVNFVFNGDAPFDLIRNKISGAWIETKNPALTSLIDLLKALNMINPKIPVIKRAPNESPTPEAH